MYLSTRIIQRAGNTISDTFQDAINDPILYNERPDAIWTALQNIYYTSICKDTISDFSNNLISVEDLINKINSVRNGWVKSSGTAFEIFLVEHYNKKFLS